MGSVGSTVGGIFNDVGNLFQGSPQQSPQLPGIQNPYGTGQVALDQNQISGLESQLGNLYGFGGGVAYNGQYPIGSLLGQTQQNGTNETNYLNNMFQTQDQDLTSQLTSTDPGSLGGQLQGSFNNNGMLNSGAFNSALANQFGNLAQQQNQEALQAGTGQFQNIQDILNQATQTQAGLGQAGVQNNFNLEDWYNNANQSQQLAQLGANVSTNTGNQQGQNQVLGTLGGLGGKLGGAAILS